MSDTADGWTATEAVEGSRRGQLIDRANQWLREGWDNPTAVNTYALAKRLEQGEELVRLLVAELARTPEQDNQ